MRKPICLYCLFCLASLSFTNYKPNIIPLRHTRKPALLTLRETIVLPKVKGGFDLMAVDVKRQRLFVSATDNHTVEVLDLKNARPVTSIPNLNEPKWVVYRPETDLLYIATGKDGKVSVYNARTFKFQRSFSFKEKSNNLRYDVPTHQLYVGVGNSFGALGVIDVRKNQVKPEISLADYPKQFEIDGNRIYVNIPARNMIQVVDRKTNKVVTNWPITGSAKNVPMGIDRPDHRLFIGCEPGKFLVLSTQTGKLTYSTDISKDADGIYYDAKRKFIYVSCGEGKIEIIKQAAPDQYQLLKAIPTVAGAATSLYAADLDRFILAVPQSASRQAEIRIYQPGN